MSNNSYTPSTFAHASLYKTNPSIPCCSMNTPGTQSGNNERLPVAPTATSRPRRPSLMRLRTLSEADHSPGWQSWIDRNNFAFFIFGLLVPLPVATVLSASRLMFPGYTGISGIILAVPAAIVSFALPMLATRISYNIILLLNVLLGILALLFSTLGSDIAGPIIGTALAGISSALGQYLYLGVAASYDQRVVITFSLGTRSIFVIREGIYVGLMTLLHQDWRWTLRVVMLFPVIQVAIWSFMLSQDLLQEAERTRKLIDNPETNPAIPLAQDSTPTVTSAALPKHFGPGRTKKGFLFRTILPMYTLPLTVAVSGAMIATTGLASTYIYLNSFKLAPKGDLNFQLNWLASGLGEIAFAMLSLFRALPFLWGWAILQSIAVAVGIANLFYPFLTYFPIWLFLAFLIGGFEGAAVTNTNYKIAEDLRKSGDPEEVRAFAMSYGGLGNFLGDTVGGGVSVAIQELCQRYLQRRV